MFLCEIGWLARVLLCRRMMVLRMTAALETPPSLGTSCGLEIGQVEAEASQRGMADVFQDGKRRVLDIASSLYTKGCIS